MSTVTKRWWRVAVVAVVAGGAIGAARYASAEPPAAPTADPAVWARSAAPPAPALLSPAVVQASAAFPVPPAAAAQPPAFDPPGPRAPLAPPALPGGDLPGIPPAPKPIDLTPVAPPLPLAAPPLPLPSPSPLVPPPAEIAQPAPPAKLADPIRPIAPPPADFNLQPPKSGNTVRTDDRAPAGLPVAPVVPPVTTPVPPYVGPRGDVPALPVDRPKPTDAPLLDSEKFTFPLPAYTPPTPPHGDPVMMHYFKQSALAAVIGGALAGAPLSPVAAFPAPSQVKPEPTPAELKKAIDDTDRRLAEIDKSVKRLVELLDGRKDEKGYKLESDPGVVAEVRRLKDTVTSLQAQIDAMKKTEVLRPPSQPADPMAGKGTVRVVNDYPVEISIVVNEKSYRVGPNSKQDVPVPSGDFSYQLLQNGASAVKSTIKEKEVVTLRIK